MTTKVTIHTVAELAGVSAPTVSRVLNNPDRVRLETRDRVLQAVRALNYFPNENARRMKSTAPHSLGVIVPQIRDFFFSDVYKGMHEAATAAGVQLVLHDAQQDAEVLIQGFKTLQERGCSGIVLTSEPITETLETIILRVGIPVVLVLTQSPDSQIPAFMVDEVRAAFDATSHLISRGHRRIGLISCPLQDPGAGKNRYDGYVSAMRHYGLEIPPDGVVFEQYRFDEGYAGMEKLLSGRSSRQLTAVFATTDEMAIGAMRCLHDHHLRVPEDISIVGFDDLAIAKMVTPTLTTIAQPFSTIGAEAISCLLRIHAGNSEYTKEGTHFIGHHVVIRESVQENTTYDSS